MSDENKQLTQEVIDRLLYCDGYREALEQLNGMYTPDRKITHNPQDPKLKEQ